MARRSPFRPLGPSGRFPAWFKTLRGRSGVYFIKSKESGALLYIGESHTDRLHKTLARHFQAWTGKTAGATYRRGQVTVAVEIVPASKAVEIQNALICSENPRDNKLFVDCDPPDRHPHDEKPEEGWTPF